MQAPETEVDMRTIEGFAEIGCTRLELMVIGDPAVAIEQLAPVVERTASL